MRELGVFNVLLKIDRGTMPLRLRLPFAHAWAGLVNSAHASRYNFLRQFFRAR